MKSTQSLRPGTKFSGAPSERAAYGLLVVVPRVRVGDPNPFFGVKDPGDPRRDNPDLRGRERQPRQGTHIIYVQKTCSFMFYRLATALNQDLATSLKLVLLLYWLGRNQFQSTPGQPAPRKPVWSTLDSSQSTLRSL